MKSRRSKRNRRNKKYTGSVFLSLIFLLLVSLAYNYQNEIKEFLNISESYSYKVDNIPEFDGKDFIEINNNVPDFEEEYKTTTSFEIYSPLDSLGRCTQAFACVSLDTMPDEERGSIGNVKPSGWHTVKYDIVEGKYLYNRCHLLGYQLTGENANDKNLITCTRKMNAQTMLKYENMVANYIKETHNHVLYRVTPIFEGDNLVAKGVLMEGFSIEDNGKGISFNVFVYNVQPGIVIDYKTGESHLE